MSLTHQVSTKVLSAFIAFAMILAIIMMPVKAYAYTESAADEAITAFQE